MNEKTFPVRMDNNTYGRLLAQAQRFGLSVTSYIRIAFTERLEKDEATQVTFEPTTKKRRK